MEIQFAQSLATVFAKATQSIYKEVFQLTNDILQPFLVPVLSLYLALVGYQYIMGNISQSKDVIIRLFLIIPILTSVIFNFETYNMYISEPILSLKDGITNAISSLTAGENLFKWLDTIFIKLILDIQSKYFDISLLRIRIIDMLVGLAIIIPFFFMYVYATVYSLQSLVFTSLLLLMGPIFLFFLMFNATKSLFFVWFRALMTYSLYSIMLALIFVFIYEAINLSVTTSINNSDKWADYYTIFIAVISVIFVKMVPELSNALSQGSSNGSEASNFSWSRISSKSATGIFNMTPTGRMINEMKKDKEKK